MKLRNLVVLLGFSSMFGVALADPVMPASMQKLSVPDVALACALQIHKSALEVSRAPKIQQAQKTKFLLVALKYRTVWREFMDATSADTGKGHVSKLTKRMIGQSVSKGEAEVAYCMRYAQEIYETMSKTSKDAIDKSALDAIAEF